MSSRKFIEIETISKFSKFSGLPEGKNGWDMPLNQLTSLIDEIGFATKTLKENDLEKLNRAFKLEGDKKLKEMPVYAFLNKDEDEFVVKFLQLLNIKTMSSGLIEIGNVLFTADDLNYNNPYLKPRG